MPKIRISSTGLNTRITEQVDFVTVLFVSDSDRDIISSIVECDLTMLHRESVTIEMNEEIFAYLLLMTERTLLTNQYTSKYLTIPK